MPNRCQQRPSGRVQVHSKCPSECRAGWVDDAMLVATHNHTSAGTRLTECSGRFSEVMLKILTHTGCAEPLSDIATPIVCMRQAAMLPRGRATRRERGSRERWQPPGESGSSRPGELSVRAPGREWRGVLRGRDGASGDVEHVLWVCSAISRWTPTEQMLVGARPMIELLASVSSGIVSADMPEPSARSKKRLGPPSSVEPARADNLKLGPY